MKANVKMWMKIYTYKMGYMAKMAAMLENGKTI